MTDSEILKDIQDKGFTPNVEKVQPNGDTLYSCQFAREQKLWFQLNPNK